MATVNFPELVDKIETFRIASMAYEAWISSAARTLINKTGEISEGHEEMLREYYAGLNSLQGTLKKYAKKNLEISVMRSGVSLVLRVKMSRTSLRVKRAGEAIPGKEDHKLRQRTDKGTAQQPHASLKFFRWRGAAWAP